MSLDYKLRYQHHKNSDITKNLSSLIKTKIWAIGGGKGGIGKSLITCNLGLSFTRLKHKVLLVDADLGAPNLHTFLGVEGNRLSLSRFLKNKTSNIQHIISRTNIPGLDLINGAKDLISAGSINRDKFSVMREAFKGLEYDHILLDIGPGTYENTINLFLLADEGILVTTPELTSIENTYRFIKCLFLHQIKKIISSKENNKLKHLIQMIISKKSAAHKPKTVLDIIRELRKQDWNDRNIIKAVMGETDISLVVNHTKMLKSEYKDLGISMKKVFYDYFGIEMAYTGKICYENYVEDSIRYSRPLIKYYNNSAGAKAIKRIAQELLERKEKTLPWINNIQELSRRKQMRVETFKECILSKESDKSGEIFARTMNISKTGIGIKLLAKMPFEIGEAVNVYIDTIKVNTSARVKWTKKYDNAMVRAGLKFL